MNKPKNHFELLWNMQEIMDNLARAQALIDVAREAPDSDNRLAIQCDRKQIELNETKAFVEQLFIDVPRSN